MTSIMQGDYQVLCALISNSADRSLAANIKPSQWEALTELARAEGVAPLLYDRLKNRETGIPEIIVRVPVRLPTLNKQF